MGGKQRPRANRQRIRQVLRNSPRNTDTVKGAGTSADFIQDDK